MAGKSALTHETPNLSVKRISLQLNFTQSTANKTTITNQQKRSHKPAEMHNLTQKHTLK